MTDWGHELRRTADCIPLERLDEELTPREHSHLAHCTRCQTELALWQRMNETAGDADDVDAVAAEVRRRRTMPSNVVAMPALAERRRGRRTPYVFAAAAMVVLVVGIGVFVDRREPSIEKPAGIAGVYRSASVDVIAPIGDVGAAPAALRWQPVAGATEYDVAVMEVDRNVLWRASVREPRAVLPAAVVAQFVPGKTILWQVQARRGATAAADSGVQRFRVQ